MGGGKHKKKSKAKKKGGNTRQSEAPSHEDEVAEELLALSAIFQDDFNLTKEQPFKEFSINLRPHSECDDEFLATLVVRCLPGYPFKPPKLHISTKNEDSGTKIQLLQSMLVEQAASIAREGRVMIFNLVETAQEYLSECTTKTEFQKEVIESPVLKESGWTAEPVVQDEDFSEYIVCDIWGEHEGGWEESNSSHHIHLGLDQKRKRLSLPEVTLPQPFQSVSSVLDRKNVKSDLKPGAPITVEGEETNETESSSNDIQVTEFLHKVRSGLYKMGRAVKHSILPGASKWEDDSDSGEEFEGTEACLSSQDENIRSIQKDLILGHLLQLVCGPRGPLPRALPSLASQLSKLGIFSSWAEDLVAQQPLLFEATFKRVFIDLLESNSDAKAVASFWNTSSEFLDGETGSVSSRYLSNFEEVCLLGKGGFGHVVLCKNNLDGRRYAMKKVRLKDKSPSVNDKILREVATLSRLQHQHVVRYYQAWFETAVGSLVGTIDGMTEEFESSADLVDTGKLCTSETPEEEASATFLFIQMEYCPRTLREIFDNYTNLLDKDVTWRIFRQIVEGLAHIHGQGIIHRDLTPSNIFFDVRNDIKIGDFGLAKFTALEQSDRDGVPSHIDANIGSLEGTGQVGTYFYTAPEIEQAWPHIDEKADMYSLGVILFELWHPFSTGMERCIILNELKQQMVLPVDWVTKFPQQAALVKLLLAPHPSARPSAREVLRSELLPPRMEDEALNDILRALQSAENSSVYDQVIAAIFDEDRIAIKTDREPSSNDLDCRSMKWLKEQEQIAGLAKEVFTRHGAQSFESTSMSVVVDPEKANRNAVKVVSSSGSLLEFRYETRLEFARWVTVNQRSSFKRYEISHVYRKGVGQSPPKEFLQGDFDIVGGSRALAEAEAIKVALEIVYRVPSTGELCEVRLNHRDILNAIWDWAGVKRAQRKDVAQVLATMSFPHPQSSARKSRRVLARRQLLQGLQLPEVVVDRLQTAESRFTGNADDVLARLRGILSHSTSALNAIEEVSKLLSYLRVWQLEKTATMDVLMTPAENYFDGIYFQIHLSKGNSSSSSSSSFQGMLVAVGGRCDALLQQRYGGDYRAVPGAVGLTIALQKLVYMTSSGGDSKLESGTEVLVCSKGGGGLLKERMEVAAELWAANIKADYVCSTAPSLTEQYEHAHENGIKWLVIITDSGLSQSGLIKVRHLELKAEVEVPREDVVKFFLTDILSTSTNLKKKAAMLRHSSILSS